MTAMRPPADEPFWAWFRRMLKERGWSQDRAAREIEVSNTTIRNWYREPASSAKRSEPRYAELKRIAEVFGELPPELVRIIQTDLGDLERRARHRGDTEDAGEDPGAGPGDLDGE